MNCILMLTEVRPPRCFLQSTLASRIGFDLEVVVLSPGCQGYDLFSVGCLVSLGDQSRHQLTL